MSAQTSQVTQSNESTPIINCVIDYVGIIFIIFAAAVFVYLFLSTISENRYSPERFGALQSLYSNDGIQDAYLTVENDPDVYYDPYNYWRNITWNLPTRNLMALSSYPYLYDKYKYVDRYNILRPFW